MKRLERRCCLGHWKMYCTCMWRHFCCRMASIMFIELLTGSHFYKFICNKYVFWIARRCYFLLWTWVFVRLRKWTGKQSFNELHQYIIKFSCNFPFGFLLIFHMYGYHFSFYYKTTCLRILKSHIFSEIKLSDISPPNQERMIRVVRSCV